MKMTKTKKITLSILLVLIASLVCSLAFYFFKFPGERMIFFFEGARKNGEFQEARFLKKNESQEKINLYVDELLLGPTNPEYKLIFARGTKALFCFVRDGNLFVNFSDDINVHDASASEIKKGIELFRKNILYNFNNIHTIEIFVAGQSVSDFAEK